MLTSFDWNFSVNNSTYADTSTASATFTQIGTATPTITLPLNTTSTETPTPSATVTIQPTISSTSSPTNTPTKTSELTKTPTKNITNTPSSTETFVPLPSITLLFPINTATKTPIAQAVEELISSLPPTETTQDIASGLSARSILLVGIVILVWAILGIFLIFFTHRLLNDDKGKEING